MANHNGQSSADIEREVEAQRAQVESTIGEIKERLTPGQLVDELLSYTKHGGAHFASNLGQTVTANPLPAALLGVSLAWLIFGGQQKQASHGNGHDYREDWERRAWNADRGYMAIRGSSLQRLNHARGDDGLWYSEWSDDGGAKYRARSDQKGNRLGHFMDEAGKAYAGFFDEAGNRIAEFRDEAGNVLDDAFGWANHAWQDASSAASQQFGSIADSARRTAGEVQHNAARMSRDAMHLLEEQPLVMGALSFAAGAALGAAIPHTRQEDEMLGEMADEVKDEAGHIASDLYAKGKEKAGEIYEEVSEKAGEIYSDAKRKLTDQPASSSADQETTRH
jgi:hypothetical protein